MLFRKSTKLPEHNETDKIGDVRDGWSMDDQQNARSHTAQIPASQPAPVSTNIVRSLTSSNAASQELPFRDMLQDTLLITGSVLIGGLIMATIIHFS